MSETPVSISAILESIDPTLMPVRAQFEAWLRANIGEESESNFELKQQTAATIQEIANRLKIAFRCTTCGAPSRLRVIKTKSTDVNGFFAFAHSIGKGKTTHGGTPGLPVCHLIEPAPDDRRTTPLIQS